MCKKLLIIIILKSVIEAERIVCLHESTNGSFEFVLVVIYVCTDSVPAETFFLLGFGGKTEHLHAVIIKRIWLGQIDKIELDFLPLTSVSNSEEKPLGMAICVDIVAKD